jgi:ATP-dependent DNA helicase RecG
MLNVEQLKALMADVEAGAVVHIESTNHTDKFGQAICAFANDLPNHQRPGYLLVA